MRYTKTFTKSILAAAVTAAMIGPATVQAFEAKLSGQVSRMMVLPDDAAGDETQHQDIGWSGSRFRFTGSEKADNGIEYGLRFEIQARNNRPNANGGTLKNTGDNQDNRYQDLYFSGNFGKISFGKGDGAANGSTEVDMSGTALSSSSNHQDNWGAYKLTLNTAGTTTTTSTTQSAGGDALVTTGVPVKDNSVNWGDVFLMKDALSRQNRVRYDTPSFNGLSLAFSLNQGNASEFAVRYKGDFDGTKFGAAIFSATDIDTAPSVDGNDITGGSASLLLGNGLNFTVATSEIDLADGSGTQDATTFKVGYKTGMHAFSIDVGDGENAAGQEGETTGFTYAVFPHKGVEIFVTQRELDSTNVAGAQSVDITAIGSRIKF